jgi:hypothetical protein
MSSRAAILVVAAALLLGSGWMLQRRTVTAPEINKTPVKPGVIIHDKPPATSAANETAHEDVYYVPKASAEIQQRAEALIRRLKRMPRDEVMNEPDVKRIHERVADLLNDPAIQKRIADRLETLKAVTGVKHGSIELGDGQIDTPFARAMIEAALANDAQRIEQAILRQLDGATFEFGFDPSMRESSGGVRVTPSSAPQP